MTLYKEVASKVKVVSGCTYELLRHAHTAVVNSGTATLETALFDVPQVVVYHVAGGRMAYQLKEWFIHTKHVSLVNIIAGREVVKELIAHLFTEANLEKELEQLLTEEGKRKAVRQGYAEVRLALGSESASDNAARDIVHSMQKN
jgi:lipid-A-disaccharide synthase